MGIFNLIYDFYIKKEFSNISKNNSLNIDFKKNKDDIHILKEIFNKRVYSDYFPFYKKSVILDIGAHKGYFSLFAKNNTKKESRIIAFEPLKKNYDVLFDNIKKSDIEIYNKGVFSENCQKIIHINKNENSSLFDNYSKLLNLDNSGMSELVNLITLEEIFETYKLFEIDFMKIDCEGSEYPFLFTASKKYLDKIKVISMEFHDLKDENYNGLEMVKFLEKNNFIIKKFTHEPTTINNNFGKIIAIK